MISRKVLVLGATGGTGQQLVTQALQQGHIVTALVRDPRQLSLPSAHLRVVAGSVTDYGSALATAMHGQDVVISALGVGSPSSRAT